MRAIPFNLQFQQKNGRALRIDQSAPARALRSPPPHWPVPAGSRGLVTTRDLQRSVTASLVAGPDWRTRARKREKGDPRLNYCREMRLRYATISLSEILLLSGVLPGWLPWEFPLAVVLSCLVVTRHHDCTTDDRYPAIPITVPVICSCPLPEVCPSLSPRPALFPPATQKFPLLGFACFDFAACRRGPRSTCCGPGDQLHLPGRQPQRTNHCRCFSRPRLLLTIAGHLECRVAVPLRFFGFLCFYHSSRARRGSSTEQPLLAP